MLVGRRRGCLLVARCWRRGCRVHSLCRRIPANITLEREAQCGGEGKDLHIIENRQFCTTPIVGYCRYILDSKGSITPMRVCGWRMR